jgi:hypothetical protein
MSVSDDEMKILQEVAQSRGITVEALLAEMLPPPPSPGEVEIQKEDDHDVVVFRSKTEVPEVPDLPAALPQEETESGEATDDRVEAVPLPPEAEEPPAPAPASDGKASSLATDPAFHVCKQCGWRQSEPVIAEPSSEEINDFLQVCLGQKLFSKEYHLFGGKLSIRLRTLHIRELEALYEAAYRAQKSGIIQTPTEYYDYINKLRVFLQIERIAIVAMDKPVIHDLPKILNAKYSHVSAYDWEAKLKELGKYKPNVALLDQVRDYIIDHVLTTEHLQRIVTNECLNFNRLVVMLESRVNDPNFYGLTETLV